MAALALGLPPGVKFRPEAEELVALYLLPRACGQLSAIPGIVIEDEGTSAAVPPWEVLARHGRAEDDEAYFFERVHEEDGKSRACGGGAWTWMSQRRTADKALRLAGGEEVWWNRRALNLHKGRGRSGSTGWVMHEYTITSPPCAFPFKICHVAFTGHGQKRKRLPDDVEQQRPCKRAAAESSQSEGSTTTFLDQEFPLPLGQDQKELHLPLGQQLGQEQERFLNQHTQGFNQEQLLNYEGSSSVLTLGGLEVGSSQETCPGQQELAYNQQQQSRDNFFDYEAYGALLSSDIGPIQEPPAGQILTQEQLCEQQLNHFLRIPANAEETGTTSPLNDQGSPLPWDDMNLDDFLYVPPDGDYYDNNDMATGDRGGSF